MAPDDCPTSTPQLRQTVSLAASGAPQFGQTLFSSILYEFKLKVFNKKCGTTCFLSNNRHRQAPSLKTEIQAVRTHTDMCTDRAYSSLEVGRPSERPNKIGGFVVQGILRFTHPLSCRRPIAGLPYKDNGISAQSAGCGGINQLLVKFFTGSVRFSSRTKLR